MGESSQDVIVIGAGLAGLCCAKELASRGIPVQIVEGSDGIGGRMRTDEVQGYLLDRGFHVFLTAYPEAKRNLEYLPLELGTFNSGAIVRYKGKFRRIYDPVRHPELAPLAAVSGIVNPLDGMRAGIFVGSLKFKDPATFLTSGGEQSTEEALTGQGFSESAIEHFLKPFWGGIFLQNELTTSSRLFRYISKMFVDGDAGLPAGGIGAIPKQIAAKATAAGAKIRLNAPVGQVHPDRVILESGETIHARAVVVATDCPEAVRFCGESVAPLPGKHGSTCVIYYGADKDPNLTRERTIILNGDGPEAGPVNHVAVVSSVQPTYAPPGKALISVNTIGHTDDDPAALEKAARAQLKTWYGDVVSTWRHLRTYRIPYALPPQDPPTMRDPERSVRVRKGLYVCGDHRDQKTQQGAMMSGRRAAEAVAADLA